MSYEKGMEGPSPFSEQQSNENRDRERMGLQGRSSGAGSNIGEPVSREISETHKKTGLGGRGTSGLGKDGLILA